MQLSRPRCSQSIPASRAERSAARQLSHALESAVSSHASLRLTPSTSSATSKATSAASDHMSMSSASSGGGRGQLRFTRPLRPSPSQFNDPQWMTSVMRHSMQHGQGEMVLIEPPAAHQFPPPTSLVPSPHSSLFLRANEYEPCSRRRSGDRVYGLVRSTSEAENCTDVRYDSWQRVSRKQERDTHRQAAARRSHGAGSSKSANGLNRLFASSSSRLSSSSAVPPQPHHPLFTSLPEPLKRLDDPLSIRAFIEAQKHAYSGGMITASELAARKEEAEGKDKNAELEFKSSRYVSFTGTSHPRAAHVLSNIEAPPMPDPDPEEDELIRYAKNEGHISLVRPEQISGPAQQHQQSSAAAAQLRPYEAADPLGHLAGTFVHPLHPCNLLSVTTKDYAHRRQQAQKKRHQQLQQQAHQAPFSSSSASPQPEADESDSDDELDESQLDTKGSGVLEPTLYCGSRGSITSMHAENDQLCSAHQLASGIKIWYSVTSTRENNRKLLKLMRQMAWCNEEESQVNRRELMDDGLKRQWFFFSPHKLLEQGMDVWVTVQTPRDSLVLTAGAFHQIINLTAVEGWSCNFLPDCQIDTVESVRAERNAGWLWPEAEAVSLVSLCWQVVVEQEHQQQDAGQRSTLQTTTSMGTRVSAGRAVDADRVRLEAPLPMRQACARVLIRSINDELESRRIIQTIASAASSPRAPAAAPTSASQFTVIDDDDDDEGEVEWLPMGLSQTKNHTAGSKRPAPLHAQAPSSQLDDLPFRLPLHTQLPPRGWPELCGFCHNICVFSAVYVADCTDAPLLELMGQGAAVCSPEDVQEAGHERRAGRLLCCTACLAKFLSHHQQHPAARVGRIRNSAGSSKQARLSAPSLPVRSWEGAGVLPTEDDNRRAFIDNFAASMRADEDCWRLAYLGERHSVQYLLDGLDIAQGLQQRQSGDSKMGQPR